jgi:ComF family protein
MKPYLIPIPATALHIRERGYNQTEELCQAIISNDIDSMLMYEKNILIKTKETISQTKTKNRRERLQNMNGVFNVDHPEKISGKICILIDDVTTTGATIGEAKRTLKQAGAKKVYAYTIAH